MIKKISNNYNYIIAHYNKENEKLTELKKNLKDKLILLKGDFSDENKTYEFVNSIKNLNLIPTDIVHLPAGKFENMKFSKLTWNKFQSDIDISLRSLVIILSEFLPIMSKNRYGKIIVMLTSCTKNIPPKYLASYVTSKYALLGLIESISEEYYEYGIMINGVSPSMIETKFLKNIPDLVIKQNALNSPTSRNLEVKDVIPTFEFLLSDKTTGITGQNIAVTNGNIM